MSANPQSTPLSISGSPATGLSASDAQQSGHGVEAESQPALRYGEVVRKILHMFPGLLPFTFAFMEHPDPLDGDALRFVTIVTAILTGIFLLLFRLVRRPGETNLISTVVSYPATILVTLLLFPAHPEFACVVVVVLAIGDGSAYIFGKTWGKTRLPWNPHKSWIGTIGFVICSAPLAAFAFWIEASPAVPAWVAILCGASAAIAGAIAESLPTNLTDNLRVGVAASVATIGMHFLLI